MSTVLSIVLSTVVYSDFDATVLVLSSCDREHIVCVV